MKITKMFIGLFALLFAIQAQALVVTPDTDASSLANVLIGAGITIVGTPTLTGGDGSTGDGSISSGTFTDGIASGIGIESGIILTSGNVSLAPGPNNSDGATGNFAGPGDPNLDALIAPNSTNDATTLNFDFTTAGGDLFFTYVFASEEYNEFVDSSFNDVFAFFVDGVNVALAGDGNPVSINNVNCGNPFVGAGPNCSQFINNDPSDGGPFFDIQYDGFTVTLTAMALGLGAGMHSISLSIADAGDFILDSAVFLAAGSFTDMPGVPEPGTLALLGLGLVGLGFGRRRLQK